MGESRNGASLGAGNVEGLLTFLDWVVRKNLATAAAITPLKSASKQVFLTVENGGEIDGIDVRALDQEDYLSRFQIAAQGSGRFTPESIQAYQRRFARAVAMYNEYLETGTVTKIQPRAAGGSRVRKPAGREAAAAPAQSAPADAVPARESGESPTGNMISYPFPLESGDVANLRLPKRLQRRDAERLNAFINALSFEPQKQIGAGAHEGGHAD